MTPELEKLVKQQQMTYIHAADEMLNFLIYLQDGKFDNSKTNEELVKAFNCAIAAEAERRYQIYQDYIKINREILQKND